MRYVFWAFISLPIYFIGGIIEHYYGTNDPWSERPGYRTVLSSHWAIVALCAIILAIGHASIIACFGIENYAGFWNGVALMSIAGGITVALLMGMFGSIIYIIEKRELQSRNRGTDNKPDRFIKASYKAFKEKHCPIIEWTEPNKQKDEVESKKTESAI